MKTSIIDKISIGLFAITLFTVGFFIYAYQTNQFEKHEHWVDAIDTNKDGIVASTSENKVYLWDYRKCIAKFEGHSETVMSVVFSNDGKKIATASIDKSIKIWSVENRNPIKIHSRHTEGVVKVQFSKSDQYLISTGFDDRMIIWDWKNNTIIKEFPIQNANFSINDEDILVYESDSCSLTFFDLKSFSVTKILKNYCGFPVFSPQKNIMAISTTGGSLTFLDNRSNKIISILHVPQNSIGYYENIMKFSPDGKYIAAAIGYGDIEIWDWKQQKLMRTWDAHQYQSITALAFNHKNQLISASSDGSLKFWNWETGKLKMSLGDEIFKDQLIAFFAVSLFLYLFIGFLALAISSDNKVSAYLLLAILTVWTFGIAWILFYLKKITVQFALFFAWATTVLSALIILTVYVSWFALYIIPFSLAFCFVKLYSNKKNIAIYIPLIINFIFLGIACGLILWQIWD